MRRGGRKALYREGNSLERPREEAKIQHEALRRGKNLGFSEDKSLEKERVREKVTLRKVGGEIEQEEVELEVSLVRFTEKTPITNQQSP